MSKLITDEKALLCSLPFALARDDDKDKLAAAVARELVRVVGFSDMAAIFPQIEKLPEGVLDILAHDLDVSWYDASAPLKNKRAAVRDCILVHKYKGTKYALETALKSMYNSARVQEWFEYGGEPFHFRVSVYGSTGSGLKTLYLKIQYAKNLRSVMDNIEFTLIPDKNFEMYVGSRLAALQKHIYARLSGGNNDVFAARGQHYYRAVLIEKNKHILARLGG